MVILELRRAETALANGRLEEAAAIVAQPAVREHRRGQALLTKVSQALHDRASGHLEQGRTEEALADCRQLETLSGKTPEVTQLKAALADAMTNHRQQRQADDVVRTQAQTFVQQGWLSAGADLLTDTDDPDAQPLQRQAQLHRRELELVAEKAEQALARQDWWDVLAILENAPAALRRHDRLQDIKTQLQSALTERITAALQQGRLDQADALLSRGRGLLEELADGSALVEARDRLRQAAQALQRGAHRQTIILLRQVQAVLGRADWLKTAIAQAQQAADSLETLWAGPLGLLSADEKPDTRDESRQATAPMVEPVSAPEPVPAPPRAPLPDRFILQVDQVGSFLVLTDSDLSLGSVSSSSRPDIALIGAPDMPSARIERHDEDCFLRGERGVEVNSRPAADILLAHRDRIALAPRCRLRFLRPNAASGTALLMFDGARYPRQDVQGAILLDRELVIGPAGAAHLRTAATDTAIVLCWRDHKLTCRTTDRQTHSITLDQPLKIGSLSLVVTEP